MQPGDSQIVYLVGAGPGDLGLLTLRAKEVLTNAEVVVYDNLVDPGILALAPAGAVLIDVGKKPGQSARQAEINANLVSLARDYRRIVRLKGGDPFVFGRGGEEAAYLAAVGIAYEVVPGISSAIAVPAYAGIPVTHRGVAQGFAVLTGHQETGGTPDYPWEQLALSRLTLIILMGVAHRGAISKALMDAGMAPTTPVAVIMRGTTPQQRTIRGSLAELADLPAEAPAVIVIGEAADLCFNWKSLPPLGGLRVVVTREEEAEGRLARSLRELGASVLAAPTITIAPPADAGIALTSALERIEEFDWLVFTSGNAVDAVAEHIGDLRRLHPVRIASVGKATARSLSDLHLLADLVPRQYVAEALVEEFPRGPGRILLPQGQLARSTVAEGLEAKGWDIETVEAYRTLPARPTAAAGDLGTADVVLFTSSSTVENFMAIYGRAALPQYHGSIGPITSDTMRRHGVQVDFEADPHDLNSLVNALVGWHERRRTAPTR
ncbi:MAG: uroporphyrinogen-III C-methyltransferase [Actinomycetota bacterium]|nr:uroporphyrinogen-III C-methyltransferase [Actinomycetota bacterium]